MELFLAVLAAGLWGLITGLTGISVIQGPGQAAVVLIGSVTAAVTAVALWDLLS